MAISLSTLSSFTTAAQALSNLVLVTPQKTVGIQPQNFPDAEGKPSTQAEEPAFLFDIDGDQEVTSTSEITDHWVENNTAIQDHWALKPLTYTVSGFIGELTTTVPAALEIAREIADRLETVSGYLPQVSVTAEIAYSTAFQLYQVGVNAAKSAVNAWSTVSNSLSGSNGETLISGGGISESKNQNAQQIAFQKLYGYQRERRLFRVQTPWAVLTDMAIESIKAVQDRNSREVTNFTVTFKMIRTAYTETRSPGESLSLNTRLDQQSSPLVHLGNSKPTEYFSMLG